jgi:hypothetical protein
MPGVSPQESMQRAAIERVRTIRTWRNHLRTHGAQVLCTCELQPGRFRKSQRVGGCGRARCWLCHSDKLSGRLTMRELRAVADYSEGLTEYLFLFRAGAPR